MASEPRIRVMIVDDHSIVRVGLQQVLEQAGGFEVVGHASDGEEAVRVAVEVEPDVVIMDVMMPGVSNGIKLSENYGLELTHRKAMASSTEQLWRCLVQIAERWRRERDIREERVGMLDPGYSR